MLTSYHVKCPHSGCDWSGILLPCRDTDSRGSSVRSTFIAVFECPKCQRRWKAQAIGDDAVTLPMEQHLPYSDILRRVLMYPTRGVAGLVDDLLTVCGEHGLQLDWRAERCRVCLPGGAWEEMIDVRLRKSVFRAILARIAALCNAQAPNSVSPYGGQGELSAGANPPVQFRVTFANTPAEQRLELMTGREKGTGVESRSNRAEQAAATDGGGR